MQKAITYHLAFILVSVKIVALCAPMRCVCAHMRYNYVIFARRCTSSTKSSVRLAQTPSQLPPGTSKTRDCIERKALCLLDCLWGAGDAPWASARYGTSVLVHLQVWFATHVMISSVYKTKNCETVWIVWHRCHWKANLAKTVDSCEC